MDKSAFLDFCTNMSLRLDALRFMLNVSEKHSLIDDSVNCSSEIQEMVRSMVSLELHRLALDFSNHDIDKYC